MGINLVSPKRLTVQGSSGMLNSENNKPKAVNPDAATSCGILCARSLSSIYDSCLSSVGMSWAKHVVDTADVAFRCLVAIFSLALTIEFWGDENRKSHNLEIHSSTVVFLANLGLCLYALEHLVNRYGKVLREDEQKRPEFQLVYQIFNREPFANVYNATVVTLVYFGTLASVSLALLGSMEQIENVQFDLRGVDIAFLAFFLISDVTYAFARLPRFDEITKKQGTDAATLAGLHTFFSTCVQMPFLFFYLLRASQVRL